VTLPTPTLASPSAKRCRSAAGVIEYTLQVPIATGNNRHRPAPPIVYPKCNKKAAGSLLPLLDGRLRMNRLGPLDLQRRRNEPPLLLAEPKNAQPHGRLGRMIFGEQSGYVFPNAHPHHLAAGDEPGSQIGGQHRSDLGVAEASPDRNVLQFGFRTVREPRMRNDPVAVQNSVAFADFQFRLVDSVPEQLLQILVAGMIAQRPVSGDTSVGDHGKLPDRIDFTVMQRLVFRIAVQNSHFALSIDISR